MSISTHTLHSHTRIISLSHYLIITLTLTLVFHVWEVVLSATATLTDRDAPGSNYTTFGALQYDQKWYMRCMCYTLYIHYTVCTLLYTIHYILYTIHTIEQDEREGLLSKRTQQIEAYLHQHGNFNSTIEEALPTRPTPSCDMDEEGMGNTNIAARFDECQRNFVVKSLLHFFSSRHPLELYTTIK